MKYLSPLLLLSLVCCASTENQENSSDYSRTFRAPYDMVWRATQQAMLNYPMNINNMDTGHLQTLYITGKHRFKPAHKKTKGLPSGYQYRININIIRGEEKARVSVTKEVRLQKDFFSDPKSLDSDGYEEKAILYRIKRELRIEKLLKRQMEKNKPDENKKDTQF